MMPMAAAQWLATGCERPYLASMSRLVFSSLIMCVILAGADARGGETNHLSRTKNARVHASVKSFGHKLEQAFRSGGGHLQKFFTGCGTNSR